MRRLLIDYRTLRDLLNDYSRYCQPGEIIFRDAAGDHTPADLLRSLASRELAARIVGIRAGGGTPDEITTRVSTLFSSHEHRCTLIWARNRHGWTEPLPGSRTVHYFVPDTAEGRLVALCKRNWTSNNEPFWPPDPKYARCKTCEQNLDEFLKDSAMRINPEPPAVISPNIEISVSVKPPEIRGGLPVYEAEVRGEKLQRREITVTLNSEERKIPIDRLRAEYHAGLLPGDAPAIVTNQYGDIVYYCGEGTVASIVAAWESAPVDQIDQQETGRMIQEFSFPDYQVTSKAQYNDLVRLYERCLNYHRYMSWHDEDFKRLTKEKTKDLVLLLDESEPGWDNNKGEEKFLREVRRHYLDLIRTDSQRKTRIKKREEQEVKTKERQEIAETRNNLTNFPHKEMQIEAKDYGLIAIREIKHKLSDGTFSPQTLVRYRTDSDWMELCEFLNDWMRKKATAKQIDYLQALQNQHGITDAIPLDIPRKEISLRINALVPNSDND